MAAGAALAFFELQAQWLAAVLAGRVQLLLVQDMQAGYEVYCNAIHCLVAPTAGVVHPAVSHIGAVADPEQYTRVSTSKQQWGGGGGCDLTFQG